MAAARKSVYQRFADGRIKKISGDEMLARLVAVIETVWPDVRARLRNIVAQESLQFAQPAAAASKAKA